MPGLLQRAEQNGPVAPAPQGDEIQGGETNASPQQQAQYEKFVLAATDMIYDQKIMPGIVERLGALDDPIESLANTAILVTQRVNDAATKAGEPVEEAVSFNAAMEIIMDLATLAKESGVHEYTPQEMQSATERMIQLGTKGGPQVGQPGAAPQAGPVTPGTTPGGPVAPPQGRLPPGAV